MTLSVRGNDELRAVALGMKLLPRTLRNDLNRGVTRVFSPIWKAEVDRRATTKHERKVLLPGTRVKPGNPPTLLAAQSRRPLGPGRRLVPQNDYAGYEFGTAQREAYSRYSRSDPGGGGDHPVERRTAHHMKRRNRRGYVVYPAVAEVAPRLAALLVQDFVRRVYDAAEGKRSNG